MKKLYLITILLALLFLQGCGVEVIHTVFTSSGTVELKNSEGHTVECAVSKFSAILTGTNSRDEKIRECIIAYEKQGYKRVDLNN